MCIDTKIFRHKKSNHIIQRRTYQGNIGVLEDHPDLNTAQVRGQQEELVVQGVGRLQGVDATHLHHRRRQLQGRLSLLRTWGSKLL